VRLPLTRGFWSIAPRQHLAGVLFLSASGTTDDKSQSQANSFAHATIPDWRRSHNSFEKSLPVFES
jgi:hypothetical protein